jgi:membrane-associated phospholipid phosphatase
MMQHRVARRRVMSWLRALTLRTIALFAIAFVASIAFVVLAAVLRTGALDRFDISVALAVHRLDSPIGDAVMKTATTIGSSTVLLPVVALVTGLAIHRRHRVIALVLVIDTAVVIAGYSALKIMFARERPRLFDKIALPTDYSFPSGHTMSAIGIGGVVAVALIALYPRARRPIIASIVVLITAVGLSRIYLGVHWPLDVAGGLLGGIPPLVASAHLIHRRRVHDRNVADLVEATHLS